MSKIIKYTLNEDGTIPEYVLNGGYLADPRSGPSPQDWTLVGLATDDAPGEVIASRADLMDYILDLGGSEWTDPLGEPVDLDALADFIWTLTP